jgi:hypothetical protein
LHLDSSSHPETARRTHARNETISRFRGGLPEGEHTPPNFQYIERQRERERGMNKQTNKPQREILGKPNAHMNSTCVQPGSRKLLCAEAVTCCDVTWPKALAIPNVLRYEMNWKCKEIRVCKQLPNNRRNAFRKCACLAGKPFPYYVGACCQRDTFSKNAFLAGKSFPHIVRVFCALPEPPSCHIANNYNKILICLYIEAIPIYWVS